MILVERDEASTGRGDLFDREVAVAVGVEGEKGNTGWRCRPLIWALCSNRGRNEQQRGA